MVFTEWHFGLLGVFIALNGFFAAFTRPWIVVFSELERISSSFGVFMCKSECGSNIDATKI